MAERVATRVLSGGGAKGAFQVGAERVLREEFGFRWERIFGVSVGALNATLLAQHEFARLMDLWLNIREEDILDAVWHSATMPVIWEAISAGIDTAKPPSSILDVAKRSLTEITLNVQQTGARAPAPPCHCPRPSTPSPPEPRTGNRKNRRVSWAAARKSGHHVPGRSSWASFPDTQP